MDPWLTVDLEEHFWMLPLKLYCGRRTYFSVSIWVMIIDIAVTSLCFCNGICARNHSRWLFSHLSKFCLMAGIFLGLKSLKKKEIIGLKSRVFVSLALCCFVSC